MLKPKIKKQESETVRRRRQVDERIAEDYRAGLSDSELIEKYHLSRKKLKTRLIRLVDEGLITREETLARKQEEEAAKRRLLADTSVLLTQAVDDTETAHSGEAVISTKDNTVAPQQLELPGPLSENASGIGEPIEHPRDGIFFEEKHWYGVEALISLTFGLVVSGIFIKQEYLSQFTALDTYILRNVEVFPFLAVGFFVLAIYRLLLRCDIVQVRTDGVYYQSRPWNRTIRKKVEWDSIVDFRVLPGRKGFLSTVLHLVFNRRHERRQADAEIIITFKNKDGTLFSVGTNHAVDMAKAIDRAKKSALLP